MIALPDDVVALQAMVRSAQAEIATRKAELTAREADVRNRDLLIEKLHHQLAGLRRQRSGVSSESLDQLELALEDEEVARARRDPSQRSGILIRPLGEALDHHAARQFQQVCHASMLEGKRVQVKRAMFGRSVWLYRCPNRTHQTGDGHRNEASSKQDG